MTLRMFAAPALIALVLAAGSARATAPVVPTLAPSELRPGQHAVVRTVFAGDSIETFDADIMGVMSNGRAEGEIILARATSPRVVQSGIAAGMSGSPVYVEGRLVGALALGWSLSKEPIFGITPIGEMLKVLDQPETAHPDGSSGPAGVDPGFGSPRYRGLSWSDDTLASVARADGGARPVTLPLPIAAGGLSPRAFELARGLFEGSGFLLTPGGRAPAVRGEPAPLVPGSAVAVDVLRGDLNFSAIGTVTYRDGDRVLIFGHPFFQAGEVRMPLSTAHIVGILPSLLESFKLGVPGTPVGVATQDRRPAVAGRIGGVPHMMPFRVRVNQPGAGERTFRFESIEDRLMMPQLLGAAVMSCLLESGGGGAQQTVSWSLTAWRGPQVLELGDVAAGDAPFGELMSGIGGPVRFLAGNTYERWMPDSVRVTLDVRPGRGQWALRDASLQSASVRPGGTARVRAGVERWRGERRVLELELPVPRDLPPGRYTVWLGGGQELDRMSTVRMPARFRPTSVDDALHRLEALRPSDALYGALWARSPDVTREGDDYPELPASALSLLAPTQSVDERTRRGDWALLDERVVRIDGALRGELVLDLNVDDRAP